MFGDRLEVREVRVHRASIELDVDGGHISIEIRGADALIELLNNPNGDDVAAFLDPHRYLVDERWLRVEVAGQMAQASFTYTVEPVLAGPPSTTGTAPS